jgi:hypothetical protein
MDPDAYPCACCGFLVFSEPPGSHEICELCGWEDDLVQLRFPGLRGGANACSLAECQARALASLDPSALEHGGYQRAPGWRPLLQAEVREVQPAGNSPSAPKTSDRVRYYWEVLPVTDGQDDSA